MELLLDTHIILWSLLEPERLRKTILSRLQSDDSQLWISPISIWEIMILDKRKKIRLLPDAETWIRGVLGKAPFREAHLNREVAIRSCLIKLPHKDPADRFLAATAVVFDLTLVTSDKRLQGSREYKVLKN